MSLAKYLARAQAELRPMARNIMEGAELHGPGQLHFGDGLGDFEKSMGRSGGLKKYAADHPAAMAGLGAAGGVAADEALSDDDDELTKILKKIGLA